MTKAILGLALLLASSCAAIAQSTPAVTHNWSVAITTGGTFQTILAAGAKRSLTIQNNNTSTDNCYLDFGVRLDNSVISAGTATKAESVLLKPGEAFTRYFPYIPNDEIEATCDSDGNTLHVDYN